MCINTLVSRNLIGFKPHFLQYYFRFYKKLMEIYTKSETIPGDIFQFLVYKLPNGKATFIKSTLV